MGAIQGWGQSGSLVVSGTLKHEETKQRLENVTVSVLQNGEAFDEIQVDRNGKYFLELPLRNNYILIFQSEGMISKRVAINSAETPENELTDGFEFDVDMSLFDAIEGFDESLTETPIGIASFDDRSGSIQFDADHTKDMRRRIDNELDRLADLADDMERTRMRYDNAMEDAARAEARGRWEEAKDEFQKALNFIPADPEAKAGLNRVNTRLDAIRQEEEQLEAKAAAAAEAEAEAAAQQAKQEAEQDAAVQTADDVRTRATDDKATDLQAQTDPDSAAQQEVLSSEGTDRELRQSDWEASRDAREAEIVTRDANSQAGSQNLSRLSSNAEDEAEEYYRRALESERQARVVELQEVKEEVARQKAQWRAEGNDRAHQSVALGSNADDLDEQKNQLREAKRDEIDALKRSQAALNQTTAERSKRLSEEAYLETMELQEAYKQRGVPVSLSPADRDIPQGVNETSYDIQNGLVIMRTVREGDVVKRYRKVVMKTGTYYFFGDQSITPTLWDLETNLSND